MQHVCGPSQGERLCPRRLDLSNDEQNTGNRSHGARRVCVLYVLRCGANIQKCNGEPLHLCGWPFIALLALGAPSIHTFARYHGTSTSARPKAGCTMGTECCVPQQRDVGCPWLARFLGRGEGAARGCRTTLLGSQTALLGYRTCEGVVCRVRMAFEGSTERCASASLTRGTAGPPPTLRDRGQSLCAHTHGVVCVAIAVRHDAKCTAARRAPVRHTSHLVSPTAASIRSTKRRRNATVNVLLSGAPPRGPRWLCSHT